METHCAHPALRAAPQNSCWQHQGCGTMPSVTKFHQQKAELKITPNASSGCFPQSYQVLSQPPCLVWSGSSVLRNPTSQARGARENGEVKLWALWERASHKYLRCVLSTGESSNTARASNARAQGKRTWTGIIFHETSDVKMTRNKNNVSLILWSPLVCF